MPRPNIISIDFIRRYDELVLMNYKSGKMIYHEMSNTNYGYLWNSYAQFLTWMYIYKDAFSTDKRRHPMTDRRILFSLQFLFEQQKTTYPIRIFYQLNIEYSFLWPDYKRFLNIRDRMHRHDHLKYLFHT